MREFMTAILGLLALVAITAAFVGTASASEMNSNLPKCPSWYQCRP
jgi:hypothetical protein